MTQTTASRAGSRWLYTLSAIVGVGATGSLFMAIAHAGVSVPLISAFGPQGNVSVPPAAAGFAVAAVLLSAVAVGVVQRRPWAWGLGLAVSTLVLVSAAVPYRGAGSAAGIAVSLSALVLLLARPVRAELLPARDG